MVACELRLYRDAFFVGFETGGATGDQAEDPGQYLNYRWQFVQQPLGDHAITDFKFSPEYHIDEILFRQIMGTVTNAIYFKPQASYWFDLGGAGSRHRGRVIYSMAQVPVSTPGNALGYGIEMNVERQLPQHRRGLLRRRHLGRALAARRAQPPGERLGPSTPPTPAPRRCCASSSA